MRRDWPISIVLLLLLCALFLISLLAGRVWLPAGDVWHGLWSPDDNLAATIVTQLRLPRAVLALEVGAALGLSGAVLQGVTRNPLAEPGLLGVSAGAALGAVIAVYFGMATHFMAAAPLLGLIGALLASLLTFAIGRGGGTITLVLAGAAVSALAAAGISLALNLAPNPYAAYEIMTWLMGSLADRSWVHVLLVTPFILLGSVCCLHRPWSWMHWPWAKPRPESGNQPATAVPSGGIRHGSRHWRRHRGNGDHRLHRTRGTSRGAAAGGPSAEPRAAARGAVRGAAAAACRCCHPPDSCRQRNETGGADQLDWHAILLLAGRAAAQVGAVTSAARVAGGKFGQ